MLTNVFVALMIPFLGTVVGSAFVFFLKDEMNRSLQRSLTGFAAGVMVAASVWSLIIPAMEMASGMGRLSFLPAFVGVWLGFGFLLAMDHFIPHLHLNSDCPEGKACGLGKSAMLALAVALHNLPEGMAVGVVAAGWLAGTEGIGAAAAMTLSLGIALQNLPEGAIVSMPLKTSGLSRGRAFFYGAASGFVEPVGALLTIALASFVTPLLPYFLGFAAGAMLYVVFGELLPESAALWRNRVPALAAVAGILVGMMIVYG